MKLFEYLASGMPVVSTALPSLVGAVEEVVFASTPKTFADAIVAGVASSRVSGDGAVVARQQYARRHSWTERVQQALDLLRELGAV